MRTEKLARRRDFLRDNHGGRHCRDRDRSRNLRRQSVAVHRLQMPNVVYRIRAVARRSVERHALHAPEIETLVASRRAVVGVNPAVAVVIGEPANDRGGVSGAARIFAINDKPIFACHRHRPGKDS